MLVISVDDLGWNDLNCYGSPLTETPNLDGLARRGAQFMQGYAASPGADESYLALQTGWHPAREKAGESMGRKAGRAGYFTASVGRNARAGDYREAVGEDLPRSLESWTWRVDGGTDTAVFVPEYLTDEALRILGERRDEKWLLTLRYPAPTEPLSPPETWAKYYRAKIAATHWRPYPAPDYAAMVSSLDEQIGRLLSYLDEAGRLGNTFVLFTANSGGVTERGRPGRDYPTRNGILRGGNGSVYEGGIRVPFIVVHPGVEGGAGARRTPVVGTDLTPTLETFLGRLDYSPAPDGRSLLPVLRGEEPQARTLYWVNDSAWAVRRGEVKMRYVPGTQGTEYTNLRQWPDESDYRQKPPAGLYLMDSLRHKWGVE